MTENLYTKNCIRTYTGKYLDVFNPDPDMIDIVDIAWGLSKEQRFGNQLPVDYFVAQHSINCSELAEGNYDPFIMLMHDASDAYIGDLAGPTKSRLPDFMELENNLMIAISRKFNFMWPMNEACKKIDKQMLEFEWDQLMLGKEVIRNYPILNRQDGYYAFLKRFNDLSKIR